MLFQVPNYGVDNCDLAVQNDENNNFEGKHVYDELLSTERQYIEDLRSILKVCNYYTHILVKWEYVIE